MGQVFTYDILEELLKDADKQLDPLADLLGNLISKKLKGTKIDASGIKDEVGAALKVAARDISSDKIGQIDLSDFIRMDENTLKKSVKEAWSNAMKSIDDDELQDKFSATFVGAVQVALKRGIKIAPELNFDAKALKEEIEYFAASLGDADKIINAINEHLSNIGVNQKYNEGYNRIVQDLGLETVLKEIDKVIGGLDKIQQKRAGIANNNRSQLDTKTDAELNPDAVRKVAEATKRAITKVDELRGELTRLDNDGIKVLNNLSGAMDGFAQKTDATKISVGELYNQLKDSVTPSAINGGDTFNTPKELHEYVEEYRSLSDTLVDAKFNDNAQMVADARNRYQDLGSNVEELSDKLKEQLFVYKELKKAYKENPTDTGKADIQRQKNDIANLMYLMQQKGKSPFDIEILSKTESKELQGTFNKYVKGIQSYESELQRVKGENTETEESMRRLQSAIANLFGRNLSTMDIIPLEKIYEGLKSGATDVETTMANLQKYFTNPNAGQNFIEEVNRQKTLNSIVDLKEREAEIDAKGEGATKARSEADAQHEKFDALNKVVVAKGEEEVLDNNSKGAANARDEADAQERKARAIQEVVKAKEHEILLNEDTDGSLESYQRRYLQLKRIADISNKTYKDAIRHEEELQSKVDSLSQKLKGNTAIEGAYNSAYLDSINKHYTSSQLLSLSRTYADRGVTGSSSEDIMRAAAYYDLYTKSLKETDKEIQKVVVDGKDLSNELFSISSSFQNPQELQNQLHLATTELREFQKVKADLFADKKSKGAEVGKFKKILDAETEKRSAKEIGEAVQEVSNEVIQSVDEIKKELKEVASVGEESIQQIQQVQKDVAEEQNSKEISDIDKQRLAALQKIAQEKQEVYQAELKNIQALKTALELLKKQASYADIINGANTAHRSIVGHDFSADQLLAKTNAHLNKSQGFDKAGDQAKAWGQYAQAATFYKAYVDALRETDEEIQRVVVNGKDLSDVLLKDAEAYGRFSSISEVKKRIDEVDNEIQEHQKNLKTLSAEVKNAAESYEHYRRNVMDVQDEPINQIRAKQDEPIKAESQDYSDLIKQLTAVVELIVKKNTEEREGVVNTSNITEEASALKEVVDVLERIVNCLKEITGKKISIKIDGLTELIQEGTAEKLDAMQKALSNLKSTDVDFNISGIKNIKNLADIDISKFSTNLTNISTNIKTFTKSVNQAQIKDGSLFSTLKELMQGGDKLKDLATVLKASKSQIKEAQKSIDVKNDEQKRIDNIKRLEDELEKVKQKYKELRHEEQSLGGKERYWNAQNVGGTTTNPYAEASIRAKAKVREAREEIQQLNQEINRVKKGGEIDESQFDLSKPFRKAIKLAQEYYELQWKGENATAEEVIRLNQIREKWDSLYGSVEQVSAALERQGKSTAALKGFVSEYENGYNKYIKQQIGSQISSLTLGTKSQWIDKNILAPTRGDKFTEEFQIRARELKKQLEDLKIKGIVSQEDINKVKELYNAFDMLQDGAKDLSNKLVNPLKASGLADEMSKYVAKYTKLSAENKAAIKDLQTQVLQPNLTIQQYNDIVQAFDTIKIKAREAGQEAKSMWSKIGDQIRHTNAQMIAMYFSWQDWIRYIRQGTQAVIELDSALTELRKITNIGPERLEESFRTSAESAKKLGSTIDAVISQTSDWSRLGYQIDNAEKLAKVSTLFQTVGDNMTAETASKSLISTLKGFDLAADEAMDVVDKYVEVANNFSIDTEGISEAIEKSGASLKAAGNDLNQALGLIVAGNAALQNPNMVGKLCAYCYSNVA